MKSACAALLLCVSALYCASGGDRDILISRGFSGGDTYLIVCKGFPKDGVQGFRRGETAKDAALMNAQFIARDIFNETVDPVRNGSVKKFTVYDDHAVVYYEIMKKGLRDNLK
ncbi:MAG TPA: hypothetical protein PKY31_13405 [Spirochaetota bacterium]|nr:hypothetical protein [Spirochaetota bacterium]